jgi:hypothetical protein
MMTMTTNDTNTQVVGNQGANVMTLGGPNNSMLLGGLDTMGTSNSNNLTTNVVGGGGGGGFGTGGSMNLTQMMMDPQLLLRRTSMGSAGTTTGFGNMDDFFGNTRRNSFGMDLMGGMDYFFGNNNHNNSTGRRDSMDSSTAALDMAIMDLSRRRYSAAMGASMTGASTATQQQHQLQASSSLSGANGLPLPDLNLPQTSLGSFGFSSASMAGLMPNTTTTTTTTNNNNTTATHSDLNSVQSGSSDSIVYRQQLLQQQQRELEQRQKELEFQRQQLISNMQGRSYGGGNSSVSGGSGSGSGGPLLPGTMSHNMGGGMSSMYPRNHSLGGFSGSLGLGSVQSQGSLTSSHMQASSSQMPMSSSSYRPTSGSGGSASSGTSSSQKWWICQICQSKAFVSQDEALAHEAICQEVGGHHSLAMQYPHDMGLGMGMGMGRNFSLGFGMDHATPLGMGHMGHGGLTTMIDNSSRGVVSLGMDSSHGGSTMHFDRSRNMSLGMDSSSSNYTNYGALTLSSGPVNMYIQPMPLAMPSDKDWLTPLHCFVRLNCVEVFTATKHDVATPSKGKRKPIQVGQIGIRCPHCSDTTSTSIKARERGSVYYPTTISSIYNATMNLLQRHLHHCPSVPGEIMLRYETLKADDARSGTSKRYWIESALSLGLVDTSEGIRHSALPPPPLPSLTHQQETTGQDVTRRASDEYFGSTSNLVQRDGVTGGSEGMGSTEGGVPGDASAHDGSNADPSCTTPLVLEIDKPYATDFSYQLMDQMQPCVFTEADRLGKRKGLPPGFPGLACRHCFGGYGSGRFFPSTIKTLSDTSKTLNVLHNHMMRCRKCPSNVKEDLEKLRVSHDEERSKMKFGSQKAFFGRIWDRLHTQPQSEMMLQAMLRKSKSSKRTMDQGPSMMTGGYEMHGNFGGLEALAAASSPSKRSKV